LWQPQIAYRLELLQRSMESTKPKYSGCGETPGQRSKDTAG
jgi:hypothetical protein